MVPAGGGFGTGLALMLLNAKAGFFWVLLTVVLLGTDLDCSDSVPGGKQSPCCCRWLCISALALAFSGRRLVRLYTRAQAGN